MMLLISDREIEGECSFARIPYSLPATPLAQWNDLEAFFIFFFHPFLLSLIQKPITSDFPLQERDCWSKKERMRGGRRGEQKPRDNPSWNWFHIEIPERKQKYLRLFDETSVDKNNIPHHAAVFYLK